MGDNSGNGREVAEGLQTRVDLLFLQIQQPIRTETFDGERGHGRAVNHRAFERFDVDAIFAPHAGDGGHRYADALRACVAGLDNRARRALELRYRDEATRTDMAADLGMSEEGVKSLLARIRDRLRDCIERRLADD